MIESIERALTIERTLEFAAPVDRVWRALTDPEELARWFPDRVEQPDLKPGVDGHFFWEKHGSYAFRLEAVEPMKRLVWRWARDADKPLSETVATKVEWTLESRPDGGTTLRLCESGFVRAEDHEDNSKGWDAELQELVGLLAEEG
jgi:uncharacterized protein YndB with AHSA1/START domain